MTNRKTSDTLPNGPGDSNDTPVWRALFHAVSKDKDAFKIVLERITGKSEVEVSLLVEGVPFPFKAVFERYEACFDAEVRKAAHRLWKDRMGETMEAMDEKVRSTFGLPVREDED